MKTYLIANTITGEVRDFQADDFEDAYLQAINSFGCKGMDLQLIVCYNK